MAGQFCKSAVALAVSLVAAGEHKAVNLYIAVALQKTVCLFLKPHQQVRLLWSLTAAESCDTTAPCPSKA